MLKDLGRAYPAFRAAAKMAFSNQTLGNSPQRRGAERTLLSSKFVRPLDSQGKPVVNGVRLSRGNGSEYRGEREATAKGSFASEDTSHVEMEILHVLNNQNRSQSAAGSRFPQNLHRNSVLHNNKSAQGRSILLRSGGARSNKANASPQDFKSYMEKIRVPQKLKRSIVPGLSVKFT